MQPKGLIVAGPLALAAALSLFIISSDTAFSLRIIVGVALLLMAFVSTRLSLYLLVFSMLLSPEFLVGGLTGGGGAAGRGITLRFDDILLVVIGFVWIAKMAILKGGAPFQRTPLNGPIMFYIAAAGLATLIGVLGGRVKPMSGFFFWLKYYEYVFLYFMVVSAVTTKEEARGLVIASLVTCFLVSLFAIAQIPSGERASAPFEGSEGEPNTLGGYLIFMMAIVIGLLLTSGAMTNRLPLLLLLAAGTTGLMATQSRSSFLAAGVLVLSVIGFLAPRRPILMTMVLIVTLSAPLWAPHAVKERVSFTFTQAQEEGQIRLGTLRIDTSTSERLRSWRQSFELWHKFPLWGTGITGGPFMDAMYPRVLTETGLLGLVAFFVLIGSLFRMGVMSYRHATDQFSRGVALGFLLGLVGLLVHAIGSNAFLIVRIMEPFWLFAALVVRTLLIVQTSESTVVPAPAWSANASRSQKVIGRSTVDKPG
jgi:O-antigen ligase/polysaccharide polymerase Wzy-like membrane protein